MVSYQDFLKFTTGWYKKYKQIERVTEIQSETNFPELLVYEY